MTKSKRRNNEVKESTSKQDTDQKENVSKCDDAELAQEASNAVAQRETSDSNVSSNKEEEKRTQAHVEVVLLNPGHGKAEQKLESPQQRNDWVRCNPQLLSNHIAKIYERRLSRCQTSKMADCMVVWCKAFLPYHLSFSFSSEGSYCYHFLSVRNSKAEDPDLYAKELIPLAKQFLARGEESQSPHLPFIKANVEGKDIFACEIDHETQERSLLHAQNILTKFGSLLQIDLETSEDTARLANQRKISWTLVRLLTSPSKNMGTNNEKTDFQELIRKATTSLEPNGEATNPKPDDKGTTSLEPDDKGTTFLEPDDKGTTSLEVDHIDITSTKLDHNIENDELDPSPGQNISPTRVADHAEDHGKVMDQNTDTVQDQDMIESLGPTSKRKKSKKKKSKSKKGQQSSDIPQPHTEVEPISQKVSCPPNPLIAEPATLPAMSTSSRPELHIGKAIQIDHVTTQEASKGLSGTSIKMQKSADCSICQDITDPALAKLASDIKARKDDIRRQMIALGLPEESTEAEVTSTSAVGSGSAIDSSSMLVGWAYATNTSADRTYEAAGVWLWEKPATYFVSRELPCAMVSGRSRLAPVQISSKHTGTSEPAVIFDGKFVEIVPHTNPWPDIRSNFDHPDFLPPIKLAEFQACEVAGYSVWRQDRAYLNCRKEGCDRLLYDPDPSVVICQGCGPFSGIRYCSVEHQMADMDNHRKKCGSYDYVIQAVVHKAAIPPRFAQACPMIPTGNDTESYQFYRQKSTAALINGHYTLFKPLIPASVKLSWPATDFPELAEEMNRRIERLLNATFFGRRSHNILKYLYCILRVLITSCPTYPTETFLPALTTQFAQEFRHDFSYINRSRLCECEWHGVSFGGRHVSECPWSGKSDGALFGETVGEGVRSELSRLEGRYWILRAWQQQHPTESDWKKRAQGFGFANVSPSGAGYQLLGPGFEGWGAAESNACD